MWRKKGGNRKVQKIMLSRNKGKFEKLVGNEEFQKNMKIDKNGTCEKHEDTWKFWKIMLSGKRDIRKIRAHIRCLGPRFVVI